VIKKHHFESKETTAKATEQLRCRWQLGTHTEFVLSELCIA